MDMYCRHLATHIPQTIHNLCYGCYMNEDNALLHNLCSLDENVKIKFCLFYALDLVDDQKVMDEYGKAFGLALLEWPDILDSDFRHKTWMRTARWIEIMVNRLITNNVSPGD